jgi:hypothetical protein
MEKYNETSKMREGSEVKGTPKRGTDNNSEDKRGSISEEEEDERGDEEEKEVPIGSQDKAGQTSDFAAA